MSDNKSDSKNRKPKRMFSPHEKKRIVEEFLDSKLSATKFALKYWGKVNTANGAAVFVAYFEDKFKKKP